MSKAYKVSKHTVMFDKQNPKTVFSVQPVSYGLLTTDDAANQIAAESSATPGDVKNVLDRITLVKYSGPTTADNTVAGDSDIPVDPGTSGGGSDEEPTV